MAIESFILTQDYKTPYVRYTGIPHNPNTLQYKSFRKHEIVRGELKHYNNKPLCVIIGEGLFLPLNVVKKVVTKDVVSDASGETTIKEKVEKAVISSNPKIQLFDSFLVGAALGAAGVFFAEKKGWIATPEKWS